VLPNPSGLNAHYQLPDLVRLFGELRAWVRRNFNDAQRGRLSEGYSAFGP
jgi:hypothetical protein